MVCGASLRITSECPAYDVSVNKKERKGRRPPFSELSSSLDVSPSRSQLVTPACPLRVTRNPPAVYGDCSIQEETRDDYPRGSALVRGRGMNSQEVERDSFVVIQIVLPRHLHPIS